MSVKVYRNLNNGLISIQCAQTRVVLGHCSEIVIENATFLVSQAGRRRVVDERRKNVHAFVCGVPLRVDGFVPFRGRHKPQCAERSVNEQSVAKVRYNPYQMNQFCDEAGNEVFGADQCRVTPSGMWI